MRTWSTIIGYTLLTLLLTAGAAQSLSGSNTVFTDDIVDGAVTTPDIKANAVSGSKILNNSVTGTDLNESTIPGFRRIFRAQVAATGTFASPTFTIVSGDASAAQGNPTGADVLVTFPNVGNVTACIAFANSAGVTGGNSDPASFASVDEWDATRVQVYLRSHAGGGLLTSFNVMLVCP